MFLFFLLGKTLAQVPSIEAGNSGSVSTIRFYNMKENAYDVLEGSPYIFNGFLDGSVLLSNSGGKWLSGQLLRFNTYTSQLEFKDGNILKSAAAKDVRAFKITGAHYASGFPPVDKFTLYTYYQILYDGKLKLLKNTSTQLFEVKGSDDIKQGDKFSTYNYYYFLENDKMTKFMPTKKSFLKIFASNKTILVEKFITDRNLKFKVDSDFAEVMKYAETL